MLPLWVGLTQDQTLAFQASYKKQLTMQCCQVTCSVCEQVLASFPGSSQLFVTYCTKQYVTKSWGRVWEQAAGTVVSTTCNAMQIL